MLSRSPYKMSVLCFKKVKALKCSLLNKALIKVDILNSYLCYTWSDIIFVTMVIGACVLLVMPQNGTLVIRTNTQKNLRTHRERNSVSLKISAEFNTSSGYSQKLIVSNIGTERFHLQNNMVAKTSKTFHSLGSENDSGECEILVNTCMH